MPKVTQPNFDGSDATFKSIVIDFFPMKKNVSEN